MKQHYDVRMKVLLRTKSSKGIMYLIRLVLYRGLVLVCEEFFSNIYDLSFSVSCLFSLIYAIRDLGHSVSGNIKLVFLVTGRRRACISLAPVSLMKLSSEWRGVYGEPAMVIQL